MDRPRVSVAERALVQHGALVNIYKLWAHAVCELARVLARSYNANMIREGLGGARQATLPWPLKIRVVV